MYTVCHLNFLAQTTFYNFIETTPGGSACRSKGPLSQSIFRQSLRTAFTPLRYLQFQHVPWPRIYVSLFRHDDSFFPNAITWRPACIDRIPVAGLIHTRISLFVTSEAILRIPACWWCPSPRRSRKCQCNWSAPLDNSSLRGELSSFLAVCCFLVLRSYPGHWQLRQRQWCLDFRACDGSFFGTFQTKVLAKLEYARQKGT